MSEYVIVAFNPFDGLQVYGPYDTSAAAMRALNRLQPNEPTGTVVRLVQCGRVAGESE